MYSQEYSEICFFTTVLLLGASLNTMYLVEAPQGPLLSPGGHHEKDYIRYDDNNSVIRLQSH